MEGSFGGLDNKNLRQGSFGSFNDLAANTSDVEARDKNPMLIQNIDDIGAGLGVACPLGNSSNLITNMSLNQSSKMNDTAVGGMTQDFNTSAQNNKFGMHDTQNT